MTPAKRSDKEPKATNPPRLPKWMRERAMLNPEFKAWKIAWAALNYYADSLEDDVVARKAQRDIRRLSNGQ